MSGKKIFSNQYSSLPLISIVTVVFNGEATIAKTIESVIGQDYPNWEYIIIDGGSSDRTVEIIASYQDYITHWISEADSGIYDAMNKGIELAQGEIIGIINSGDWYSQNSLTVVGKLAKNSGADIITGAMIRFDTEKEISFKLTKDTCDLERNIHWGMPINHPATFVSKNTYKKLNKFNNQYQICADYDLIYRAYYTQGIKFEFTPEVLAHMSLGGISEQFSSLVIRSREHFQIEGDRTFFLLNLTRRIYWLIINSLKHLVRNSFSPKLIMRYYQLRHGI